MGAPEKSRYLSSFVVNLCDEERETNITSGNGFERKRKEEEKLPFFPPTAKINGNK